MRTVWLLIAVGLVVSAVGVVSAEVKKDAKKSDIPLYDGKPGEKIGDVRLNPKDGAAMVWVPAGEFVMGSTDEDVAQLLKENPEWEAAWFDREKPQRKVYLDGYWMYKYEVTVGQYRRFCEETKRKMPDPPYWGLKDDHPMVRVTWTDASNYAKWAGMALPTEAHWEKAARGSSGIRYPWGKTDPWGNRKGGIRGIAPKCNMLFLKDRVQDMQRTTPVGSYPSGASPYGCMDMAGNVWEWCSDWYDKDYYKSAPSRNPTGPNDGRYRVLRGGGWLSSSICRSAYRFHSDPHIWYGNDGLDYGFRLCGSGGIAPDGSAVGEGRERN